ncbi:MAG: carboxylating nicotinate-nucleotide diphosphorylase [Thaumarchaeota archaeon]|nr:carboxylating nicotinate-nucleotide diphosphorylase [Nitrososphaerota archaeon]MCY3976044.1 carboxylating nicotinate-nucleotide diphosphorylase [Nitrososphaerota archaeon]
MNKELELVLKRFLDEDVGNGDISSKLLPIKTIRAKIISKQNAIIAGTNFAKMIFDLNECYVKILKKDGENIKSGDTILIIKGIASTILKCERTVLNLLSRMSGIATHTNEIIQIAKNINPSIEIYATRKTAPGLRYFDKEAVKIGGGMKHRIDLSEAVMLKDNHIIVYGSMTDLIKKAKSKYEVIETEVDNIEDAILAIKSGSNIIMLDNFSTHMINDTITKLLKLGIRKNIKIEASGGINIKNIHEYAKTDVDYISIGAITNSVIGIDLSLEIM